MRGVEGDERKWEGGGMSPQADWYRVMHEEKGIEGIGLDCRECSLRISSLLVCSMVWRSKTILKNNGRSGDLIMEGTKLENRASHVCGANDLSVLE